MSRLDKIVRSTTKGEMSELGASDGVVSFVEITNMACIGTRDSDYLNYYLSWAWIEKWNF